MDVVVLVILLLLTPALGVWSWHWISNQSRIGARLAEDRGNRSDDRGSRDPSLDQRRLHGVSGWLYRAGFRTPIAVPAFIASTIILFAMGCFVWLQLRTVGTIDVAVDFIRSIPGGVGNVMVPFALATPWFLMVVLTLIPTLLVRSVRRKRVLEIEQDLPLLLDLLNTLSQAGVGFDAALDQILAAGDPERPLAQELRGFQADNLAGRSRIVSLRNLMRRVEIPMFSTFLSAVVQAEQVGAGMGQTLKTQATEMRARRREKATAAAMAVPTLLVVPMVVGFLPGIFVVLLGPMLYQAFGAMGQTLRGVTGQ
ncbi:type II secretion system F family protein [Rosistilla oblonga]|uniref:type II secretion system F family protein n=1 Tax=Rosistilla oblonga TaxID=2527990 RepID=UPI003A9718DA